MRDVLQDFDQLRGRDDACSRERRAAFFDNHIRLGKRGLEFEMVYATFLLVILVVCL